MIGRGEDWKVGRGEVEPIGFYAKIGQFDQLLNMEGIGGVRRGRKTAPTNVIEGSGFPLIPFCESATIK